MSTAIFVKLVSLYDVRLMIQTATPKTYHSIPIKLLSSKQKKSVNLGSLICCETLNKTNFAPLNFATKLFLVVC